VWVCRAVSNPFVAAAACIALITCLAISDSQATSPSAKPETPLFGVLAADPTYLAADHQAGVRFATITMCWSDWQPAPNVVDNAYRAAQQQIVSRYEKAGFEVVIDLGLQCPPQWVLDQPDGQLVDQFGNKSGTADFEYSARVRVEAARYLRQVVQALPRVAYYRVGLSADGELLYPEAPLDNWWAFDATAQGRTTGLPQGVRKSPYPGWIPGKLLAGKPPTLRQVRRWYNWYLGAEVNADRWEISSYRRAGFRGPLQLVMPGDGAQSAIYNARLAADLTEQPFDPFHTLNTGAVWQEVLPELAPLGGLVVDISSVGDGSGLPANNGCRPADRNVALTSATIMNWSDTRWLTYLAGKNGMPVVGENPGASPPVALGVIFNLVTSCHLGLLQWAFDDQLHDGSFASLNAYAARIHGLRR
jgi:hypothetical protein